jgi:hypothetical protein
MNENQKNDILNHLHSLIKPSPKERIKIYVTQCISCGEFEGSVLPYGKTMCFRCLQGINDNDKKYEIIDRFKDTQNA